MLWIKSIDLASHKQFEFSFQSFRAHDKFMLEKIYFHGISKSTQAQRNRNRRKTVHSINKNPSHTPSKLSPSNLCEIQIEKYYSETELFVSSIIDKSI